VRTRTERRAYLSERGYRVCEVKAADAERDVGEVLDQLSAVIGPPRSGESR
jgi:very-short-patch-repair endonuclease